ncbi:MAG: helix-turn-helix domain-containing protein [Bacillota bacterium]
MQRYLEKAAQSLNAFHKATGVGALCFDAQLNVIAYHPSRKIPDDFACLGIHRIGTFLTEQFGKTPPNEHVAHTFFLESNLVCNIAVLYKDTSPIGAFVTQPVFIRKLSQAETDILVRDISGQHISQALRDALRRTPVVPYDRIMPMGQILSSLALALFCKEDFHQQLCGGSCDPDEGLPPEKAMTVHPQQPEEAAAKQSVYSIYLMLQKHIRLGDTKAILDIMSNLNAGSIPMDQLDREDFVRSLKNSFIKSCAMGCFAAIEANAPYSKTIDLADAYIRQVETLNNINDIYELMKKCVLSFAQAVAINRMIAHSKPVRQAIEYIDFHYSEKITLSVLAQHVGLSETYLSNLIKKETGLTLSDNINKVRIDASKKLLLDTNISSLDVAQRVGFSYQNHFAAVFKKFTGFSPVEFRRTFGRALDDELEEAAPQRLLYQMVEPLLNVLENFSEFFDIARVVNPISHRTWNLASDASGRLVPDEEAACHQFWGRHESCGNCISKAAFVQNRTCMKLDCRNERVYLVMAIPKTLDKQLYVVEVLKDVTDCLRIEAEEKSLEDTLKKLDLPGELARDQATGLLARSYIEQALPAQIRQSKMLNKPLSIILCRVNPPPSQLDATPSDAELKAFAKVTSGLLTPQESWIGRYGGNFFLISLENTCKKSAVELAGQIRDIFGNIGRNGTGLSVQVNCSAQSLCEQTPNAEDLIRRALLELQGCN